MTLIALVRCCRTLTSGCCRKGPTCALTKRWAHAATMDGVTGTRFSVWAPNARRVSVVGQFNYWDGRRHPMRFRKESGIWGCSFPARTMASCINSN